MAEVKRYLSTTFPIGARLPEGSHVPKLGLLMPGMLNDYLGARYENVDSRLAVNVIDTYKQREGLTPILLDAHRRLGIDVSNYWLDTEHMRALYATMDVLVSRGHLREEMVDVLRCDPGCLKVELLANNGAVVQAGRVFEQRGDGHLQCKHCSQIVHRESGSELVMTFPEDLKAPTVVPGSFQKDVEDLTARARGMKMLVSRKRGTGLPYELSGRTFNVDVDFFWMNYLNTMDTGYNGIFVVGSNHVRRHLTHISALYQSAGGTLPMHILTPYYILPKEGFEPYVQQGYSKEEDPNLLRLLILASLSFKKDTPWDTEFLGKARRSLRGVRWAEHRATLLEDPSQVQRELRVLSRDNLYKALGATNQVDDVGRRFLVGNGYDVIGAVVSQ